jgi:hypothetical protein
VTLRLDELLALVLLLLFASDTSTNLIANGLIALSSHNTYQIVAWTGAAL